MGSSISKACIWHLMNQWWSPWGFKIADQALKGAIPGLLPMDKTKEEEEIQSTMLLSVKGLSSNQLHHGQLCNNNVDWHSANHCIVGPRRCGWYIFWTILQMISKIFIWILYSIIQMDRNYMRECVHVTCQHTMLLSDYVTIRKYPW